MEWRRGNLHVSAHSGDSRTDTSTCRSAAYNHAPSKRQQTQPYAAQQVCQQVPRRYLSCILSFGYPASLSSGNVLLF
ncbi:hypothetical protein BaRGS_00030711 [Batillaria attramentaria]|uniref:Uncharacterized protein n=1 Tax=Batillaria attramentaria TaxID=370345 RepID=A0ABD0JTR1_9CAEN